MNNYNKLQKLLLATVAIAGMTTSMAASAAVPQVVTHQGRLFDVQGVPVVDAQDITFTIYDLEVGGVPLWSETINVSLDEGYFSVRLGETLTLDDTVFDGSIRWLGITVGADPEMTPLAAIASVPYAMFAGDVQGDINPNSISIPGFGPVIDANGQWVGDPSGLQGPAGPAGAPGAVGPAGPAGAAGAVGPAGPAGAAGAVGPAGPAGAAGAVGPAGPAGAAGAVGPAGPAGAMGLPGAPGAQGAQGVQGAVGPAGAQGLQGIQGLQGAQGVQGVAGAQGASGVVVTGKFSGNGGAVGANGAAFVFVGGTTNVVFAAGQRLTGAASTSLTGAANGTVKVDLCYQDVPNAGAILNFAGGGFTTHLFTTGIRGPISAVGTVAPNLTTTLKVGLCIDTDTGAIAAGDVVNGWVQVTN